MHFPTAVRKSFFFLSGRTLLSDGVRNRAYQWAWSYLQNLQKGSRICDIGSRDSLFPAFLAWKGYRVTVVERDARFAEAHRRICKRWNVCYEVHSRDFLECSFPDGFHSILSIFSLQHAQDNDIPAYRKAASMLSEGGLMLSVCEYDPAKTRWQDGRDDGAMRIYGPQDIEERIEKPLIEGGLEIVEKKNAGFAGKEGFVLWRKASQVGIRCYICAKKKKEDTGDGRRKSGNRCEMLI